MKKSRVLLADDHAILRAGLRLLLNSQSELTVVEDVGDWPNLLACAVAARPDVVIVDLTMPGGDPFDGLRALKRACPTARVVVLTMHAHADYFRAAMAAGAQAYVLKTCADEELLSAIRAVSAGHFYVSPTLNINDELPSRDAEQVSFALLSERERQVLRLAAQGLTNREIAEQVHLSVKTIESYRARMMAKLNVSSRSEIVAYAVRHGMLSSTSDLPHAD